MLRRIISGELALGFLIGSVFWIAVLGWTTSYALTEPEKGACYQAAAKSGRPIDECKSFWERTTSDPVAAFTLVLAVSTIGLWLATIGLYRGGERQFKLANAEFISSHRPRLVLRDVVLEGDEVFYLLANVGDTPATIVEAWILAESIERTVRPRPLRSAHHFDLQGIIFAPGETKDLTYHLPDGISFSVKFPESRWIRIEGRAPVFAAVYFTGTVVYVDELGVRRRTVFRRRWDDAGRAFLRMKDERDQEYAD